MWESIGLQVRGTGNGTMTKSYRIRLKRVEVGYAGYQYWLYSRTVGKAGELVRVPSVRAEEVLDAARGLLLSFPADAQFRIGGGFEYELEFDSHDHCCKFRWKIDLPKQWHALSPVLDRLEKLRRRACLHLRPLSPHWESLGDIIADGDDAVWDRTAKTICAFRRKHGTWPTILRIPESCEAMLEVDFGQRTLEMLRERLRLVPDPDLNWSQFERIIAEDDAGNRAEYPVDVCGVQWITDEEFHFWIGVGPEQVAEREAETARLDLEEYRRAIYRRVDGDPGEGE